jgi:hypothetical protein
MSHPFLLQSESALGSKGSFGRSYPWILIGEHDCGGDVPGWTKPASRQPLVLTSLGGFLAASSAGAGH